MRKTSLASQQYHRTITSLSHHQHTFLLTTNAHAVVSIAEFYGVEDPQKEPYCPIPYPVPQTVAVKALKNDINKSEANVVDFVEEIRVLSKLRHSSITEFIGVGANDTSTPEAQWHTLFLVQEYMDSGTLKTLLLKQMVNMGKPMYSFAQAIEWAVDIAEGIEFLHGFRPMVIHRDLKCDNVMLTTDGKGPGARKKAKIADLGLHALVQENGTSSSRENTNSHRKSRSQRSTSLKAYKKYNQVKGGSDDEESDDEETILYEMTGETGAYCYMAPEVLLGQPYNEKVDVFSFGIILYELFSRRMLVADFMNTNEFDESKNHAYRVAAGFRPPCPSFMPEEMKRLVEKCWAGPPELRLPMVEITKKLKGIRDSGVMAALDESMGGGGGACCTVM